jgi:hypothetical protein
MHRLFETMVLTQKYVEQQAANRLLLHHNYVSGWSNEG